jgi:hypothetical protein
MEVRIERPPLWAEINAKFHVEGKPVLFSWGDIIYNPQGILIPPELVIHEMAHGERQLVPGVLAWWGEYLRDESFRYEEEVIAHRAELAFLSAKVTDRNSRNKLLVRTAARLTSPLYGWTRPIYCATRDLKR